MKHLALLDARDHAAPVRRALPLALSLVTLTVGSTARAYRPFDGTDADVAGFGEFELELGPAHYLSTPHGTYVVAPATVLNLGFAPGFELVVDSKNYVATTAIAGQARDRLLDTDVFVKMLLRRGVLQDETGLSVATELGPLTPELGGESGFGAQVNVITSYKWSALALHLNTSAALSRAHNFEAFASLIAEGPGAWKVRPVAEIYVDRELTVPTVYSALAGAIWTSGDHLAIDGAVRTARQDGGESYELRLGLTWTFQVWGRSDDAAGEAGSALRRTTTASASRL